VPHRAALAGAQDLERDLDVKDEVVNERLSGGG